MIISQSAIAEVEAALDRYKHEVEAAEEAGLLAPTTSRTYLQHADSFVRWLKDDFQPAEHARRRSP